MHNDVETVVNCKVAAPAALNLAALSRRDLPECMSKRSASIGEGDGLEAVLEGFSRKPEYLPIDQPLALPNNNSALAERQICNVHSKSSYRIGDGNPHQNPLHIQLSEPMECGSRDGCEIARFTSRSYSIGWSASAEAFAWLSVGFSVEMSIETGNNYACPGNANDYFAVWGKQAQTAYTVRNRVITCAGARDSGGDFVMWSPNSNNRGGYYYCVYGRQYVRWMGDRWLDTTPVPGGPP